MTLANQQYFYFGTYQLELFYTKGSVFIDYPDVIDGYLFHFMLDEDKSIIKWNDPHFQFSTNLHWKYNITGTLDELQEKLKQFKNDLLVFFENHKDENFDHFAYIHLFIVAKDEQYQLVISSDVFDVSKLISLS